MFTVFDLLSVRPLFPMPLIAHLTVRALQLNSVVMFPRSCYRSGAMPLLILQRFACLHHLGKSLTNCPVAAAPLRSSPKVSCTEDRLYCGEVYHTIHETVLVTVSFNEFTYEYIVALKIKSLN